jgi:hypothetical protein
MAWREIIEANQVLKLSIPGTNFAQCWACGCVFAGVSEQRQSLTGECSGASGCRSGLI